MLCDDLEGWDRVEGRKAQEGRGLYIIMADLGCYMAETNTTL